MSKFTYDMSFPAVWEGHYSQDEQVQCPLKMCCHFSLNTYIHSPQWPAFLKIFAWKIEATAVFLTLLWPNVELYKLHRFYLVKKRWFMTTPLACEQRIHWLLHTLICELYIRRAQTVKYGALVWYLLSHHHQQFYDFCLSVLYCRENALYCSTPWHTRQ